MKTYNRFRKRISVWNTFFHRASKRGFALISCVSVMSLLLVLSFGMLSLSGLETRRASGKEDRENARANARLALMMAISQLQEATGPDQVLTARAELLADRQTIAHKNWVGAWRTTYKPSEKDHAWPLIGQKTDKGNKVYAEQGTYSDLRYTVNSLNEGQWRKKLINAWLVSSPADKADPTKGLDTSYDNVLELLGKGTLGQSISRSEYLEKRVLVKKIDIEEDAAIGWWIADNSQKASVMSRESHDSENALLSSAGENLKLVKAGTAYPFETFQIAASAKRDKVFSYDSSQLTQADPAAAKRLLGRFTHDLTYDSPGLFTNTAEGGFQHDLTPLLFAKSNERIVDFSAPSKRISETNFTSEYPLIASKYHDVLAPTFSALRYWGLQKYATPNQYDMDLPVSASRVRSATNWPHNQSDGVTFESSAWSAEMPKVHPVMTDSRWHYYFSVNGKKIRTHIIPRVCLWNPYNTEMVINEMVVMMPNPFYQASGGFHFYFEKSEVDRVKKLTTDKKDTIHRWISKSAYPLPGKQFKSRLKVSGSSGLFPSRRYLAFTLLGTKLAPGECHVFSPLITSPAVSSNGVNLAPYQLDLVANNVLSSTAPQGEDHFYFDMSSSRFEIQTSSGWRSLGSSTQNKFNLRKIHDYRPETGSLSDNFPFVLKASNGAIPELGKLLVSQMHPTLQLVNNGTGGVAPSYYFSYTGSPWGSANTISGNAFGSMQAFNSAPFKDAPATHQVGSKLLWLDESTTEGNRAPLRYGTSSKTRWTRNHMAYHPATIANWNVRAQLTSRSPIAQCAEKWYLFSTGSWIIQFIPKTPQDLNDAPQLNANGTAFVKNPLGLAVNHASSPNVVLFDLPHFQHGVHSLGSFRHAMLSPYSWHPSYIVGHSLRDPNAPAETTAYTEVIKSANSSGRSHWDTHIGGYKAGFNYGASNNTNASDDLLQIGRESTTRSIHAKSLTSENDVLPYDIAYEVNQNLWDNYFLSTLPLKDDTSAFASIVPGHQSVQRNPYSETSMDNLEKDLSKDTSGLHSAFWLNAYHFKKQKAFNVNSTSVPAWTAFLSSTLEINRELQEGSPFNNGLASFARFRKPTGEADSSQLDPQDSDAWKGLRTLTKDEIDTLANAIVDEVKLRGPFISVADFVNRRLRDRDDETSKMGTLDAAIQKAELNKAFYVDPIYNTSMVVKGSDRDSEDNNQDIFKDEYIYESDGKTLTSQADTKTWGLPSFIMQSDLLEPLAPSLTVRGDTFTIRAYGEVKRDGKVTARAYIEAVVGRTPHYIQHQSIKDDTQNKYANIPTDKALKKDPVTGEITQGNLTEINEKLGRRYKVVSFRWLNKDEI